MTRQQESFFNTNKFWFFRYDEDDNIIGFDFKEHARRAAIADFSPEQQQISEFYCTLLHQLEDAL